MPHSLSGRSCQQADFPVTYAEEQRRIATCIAQDFAQVVNRSFGPGKRLQRKRPRMPLLQGDARQLFELLIDEIMVPRYRSLDDFSHCRSGSEDFMVWPAPQLIESNRQDLLRVFLPIQNHVRCLFQDVPLPFEQISPGGFVIVCVFHNSLHPVRNYGVHDNGLCATPDKLRTSCQTRKTCKSHQLFSLSAKPESLSFAGI